MEIIALTLGPVSNSYVVRGEKGSVMIDAGCYVTKEDVEKEFAAKGVDPKEIKLIVLTHGHFDHAGGLDVVEELTGAPIMAHKLALEFLKEGTFPAYTARNEHGQRFIDEIAGPAPVDVPDPVEVSVVLDGEDVCLCEYGVDAKVIYTPGHVASSVSVVLSSGEAFVGDTILADAFDNGKCTLALICQDKPALLKSVERLLSMGTKFFSGHGGPFTKEEAEEAYKTALSE